MGHVMPERWGNDLCCVTHWLLVEIINKSVILSVMMLLCLYKYLIYLQVLTFFPSLPETQLTWLSEALLNKSS